ncbi:BON domain-containing protein [Haliea sp. E17]|uniref:BON domain-containing protein n=1 Tax=Haliea sp. E17 TaxID=3401576 RepID=UPI003AAE0F0D
MKNLFFTLITLSLLTLTGCGNMLASVNKDTIPEDEGERTLGRWVEDENIETKALVNINAASEQFDSAHLIAVSYNGYVLLAGQVQSQELKNQATEIVRQIRGVRRIYNELEIAAPSSAMTRTSDTWITTKVKSYLLANPNTQGYRVKVVTENGVVYLMGLATSAEVDRVAEQAAQLSGVQRVVKLFELID